MSQEIRPEDLIVTEQDGTRRINHDVIESYGLFNLPRATMRQALMVYYSNSYSNTFTISFSRTMLFCNT